MEPPSPLLSSSPVPSASSLPSFFFPCKLREKQHSPCFELAKTAHLTPPVCKSQNENKRIVCSHHPNQPPERLSLLRGAITKEQKRLCFITGPPCTTKKVSRNELGCSVVCARARALQPCIIIDKAESKETNCRTLFCREVAP